MNIDDVMAEMDAIATSENLTDDQMTRYEELEGTLQRAQKTEQIQKRQAAYKATVTAPLVVATAKDDDTLDRAFGDYLRTGKENADIAELRAQGSSGSAGGYMIPDGFRNKLVDRMKAFGGVANVVEVITTETGGPLEFPTIDDTANVGEIVAEGGTFAGGADLTFGTVTLGSYKYMAGGAGNLPLRVSVELLQDAAFDVEALVANKLGERISRIQATHIVNGAGSTQPKGLVNGLTGVETDISYEGLITALHSVDPAYRTNGTWAFNDATLAEIRKLTDLDGRPLLQPAGVAGAGGNPGGETLLGRPVVIDQAFPSIGSGNWGAFGDLREGYLIRRVRDITLVVNPYSRAANGQVEFTAWARMDAAPQNAGAYVALADSGS